MYMQSYVPKLCNVQLFALILIRSVMVKRIADKRYLAVSASVDLIYFNVATYIALDYRQGEY